MRFILDLSLRICKRFYPLLFIILIITNCLISYRVGHSLQPVQHYHEITNTVYYTSIVTQMVNKAVSDFVTSSDINREYECSDYVYFVVDGRPRVRLWGRPYFIGSRTSRGIIRDIYPDMCIMDNGNTIVRRTGYHDRITGSTVDKPIVGD